MPGMNNRETDYRVYGFAHAYPYAQRVARDPCPNFNFSLEPSFTLCATAVRCYVEDMDAPLIKTQGAAILVYVCVGTATNRQSKIAHLPPSNFNVF